MVELNYIPVRHDHKAFLAKAAKRHGFRQAYDALKSSTYWRAQCWLRGHAPG